jgi:hypothetical protein
MNGEFIKAVGEVAKEKGIEADILLRQWKRR